MVLLYVPVAICSGLELLLQFSAWLSKMMEVLGDPSHTCNHLSRATFFTWFLKKTGCVMMLTTTPTTTMTTTTNDPLSYELGFLFLHGMLLAGGVLMCMHYAYNVGSSVWMLLQEASM